MTHQTRRSPTPEDAKRYPPRRDKYDELFDRVLELVGVVIIVLIGLAIVHQYAVWIVAR